MKTPSEFEAKVLAVLIEHKGEVVDRPTILARVYPGVNYPPSNTLEVFVGRLRRKGHNIRAARGTGYIYFDPMVNYVPNAPQSGDEEAVVGAEDSAE